MTVISGVSVAHDSASVEEIEAAAAADAGERLATLTQLSAVSEAFVLQTCNRAEAYVVTDDPGRGRDILEDIVGATGSEAARFLDHEESLRHLMRVTCGLESLVLGEDQIIGQVRDAYERARGAGALGPMLEDAVTKAIHVGERARDETALNEGSVSLGSAAVDLAERELDLSDAVAVVVGAGEMGRLAARSFADTSVVEVVVANRTIPHATHLADELPVDARGVGLDDLPEVVPDADVLVTATGSPEPVLDRSDLSGAGSTFVIDLAQPHDVAPAVAELPTVTRRDLDSLQDVTERTRAQRRTAAEAVEAMVDDEFEHLLEQYKRKRADDVIAAMYEGADMVKEHQVANAIAKLEAEREVSEREREIIESLADALVGQLLAAPTKSLRDAAAEDDWTTINTALQLFNPEFGGEDLAKAAGVDLSEIATGQADDD